VQMLDPFLRSLRMASPASPKQKNWQAKENA